MLEPTLACKGFWDWEKYNNGELKYSERYWKSYKPQKKELCDIYQSEYKDCYLIVHPKFNGNGHDWKCPENMLGHSWNVKKWMIDFNVKNTPCRMRTTHVRIASVDISV